MIAYLLTQLDIMNEDQKNLVERTAKMHEDEWLRIERERLATLYMWLHMKPGSVAERKFASKAKKR